MKNFFVYNNFDKIYRLFSAMPILIRAPLIFLLSLAFRVKLKYRGMPSTVTLFVTERCNLKCQHCFIRNAPEADRKNKTEMDINEYNRLFRSIRKKVTNIKVTGGEPTLRTDLAQIIIAASKKGGVKHVTIFTNGTHKQRLVAMLEATINACPIKISIQVSLDGDRHVHNEIRGSKGAYQNVLETMQALVEIKAKYPRRISRLSVATGFFRNNEHNIQDIVDIVRSYRFEHVISVPRSSKLHVFNLGNDWKSNYYPINYHFEDLDQVVSRLDMLSKIILKENKLSLFKKVNKITLDAMNEIIKNKKPIVPCYTGRADLVIYPNGDVARCEMLKSICNLAHYDYDLKSVVRSKRYRDYLNDTDGCWCLNDCAIVASIPYEPYLLKKLFM